jgi:hypothetical protein
LNRVRNGTMIRMSTSAEAARQLSKRRWGSHVADRLASELLERADELSEPVREQLRAEFGTDRPDTTMETRYR